MALFINKAGEKYISTDVLYIPLSFSKQVKEWKTFSNQEWFVNGEGRS